MQFIHRIGFNSTPEIRRELSKLGIVVGASGLVVFEVDESHDSWPALREWIGRQKALDFVFTRFSPEEIAAARWLALHADSHHGYPQPEDGFGFLEVTYAPNEGCRACGVAKRQQAPFRMRAEPKWGRRGILQLNWIFDEFFVTPDVWSTLFRPRGIGCRPVLNRKGVELKTVVQLAVEEEVHLAVEGLETERCERCGQRKYLPVTRGALPHLLTEPSTPLARTKEWFGSGGAASRQVLVSQELAQAMTAAKLRGASVTPVAAGPDEQKRPA
jgi:hypothetical protein